MDYVLIIKLDFCFNIIYGTIVRMRKQFIVIIVSLILLLLEVMYIAFMDGDDREKLIASIKNPFENAYEQIEHRIEESEHLTEEDDSSGIKDIIEDFGAYDNYIDENTPIPGNVAYIFVGDSRTVGVDMAVSDKEREYFVAETGKGVDWFDNTGAPSALSILKANNSGLKFKVIVNLGVNDLYDEERYVESYNRFIEEAHTYGAKVYFVSVNPVNDNKCVNVKNEQVESFNGTISEQCVFDGYIDTYSALFYDLVGDTDRAGLHYSNDMYKKIYGTIRYVLE